LELINANDRIVWAGIHGQYRLATTISDHLNPPGKEISAIVAGDDRQDIMEAYFQNVGFKTYPVAMEEDSLRGARELIQAIDDLKAGNVAYVYVAIDGPDGPAFVPKPGVALIAQRAEAKIIPMAFASVQAVRMKSRWDNMAFERPFSDIHAYFGDPYQVTRDMEIEDILQEVARLVRVVDREAWQRAEALAAKRHA
jgi:lysophospholipid acyltransferase (LPLAT)-like uncharacterized protein